MTGEVDRQRFAAALMTAARKEFSNPADVRGAPKISRFLVL